MDGVVKDPLEIIREAGWIDSIIRPLTATDALNELLSIAESQDDFLCRGEPKLFNSGKASLAREEPGQEQLREAKAREVEPYLVAKFRSSIGPHLSPNEIELTRTIWGTLVLMQHHRAPTRLLDWSLSPFVAAFFAALSNPDVDGYVFAVQNSALNDLTSRVKGFQQLVLREMPTVCRLYGWCSLLKRLDDSLRDHSSREQVIQLRPMRAVSRMVAQQTCFTLGVPITLDHRSWLGHHLGDNAKRLIVISSTFKAKLLQILEKLNVTSASLYPGLPGAGESIRDIVRNRRPISLGPVDDW